MGWRETLAGGWVGVCVGGRVRGCVCVDWGKTNAMKHNAKRVFLLVGWSVGWLACRFVSLLVGEGKWVAGFMGGWVGAGERGRVGE